MQDYNVALVAPNGLKFGDGSISYANRLAQLSTPEHKTRVEALINSDEILVSVDTDTEGNQLTDDGCGDGRGVSRVFVNGITKTRSLNRAKVFGGSVAQVAGSFIANGRAKGVPLQELMTNSLNHLKSNHINFGAHTDDHAQGDNCGCGAIDKFNVSVSKAVTNEAAIRATIDALGIDTNGLDDVFADYQAYDKEIAGQSFSGAKVAEEIMDSGKVVKELTGDHREMYIVLNLVEGKTIDQTKVREISNDEIQVFGVDVWRMQEIAAQAYDDATERHKAFLGMLIQTLGTAATLTAGDLPVYVVSEQQALVAA